MTDDCLVGYNTYKEAGYPTAQIPQLIAPDKKRVTTPQRAVLIPRGVLERFSRGPWGLRPVGFEPFLGFQVSHTWYLSLLELAMIEEELAYDCTG